MSTRLNSRDQADGPLIEAVLAHIASLVESGRGGDALAFAVERARESDDLRLIKEVMRLRSQAKPGGSGRPDWPPAIPDLLPGKGVPEIAAADLSVEAIGAGILHHGAVIVRGLLTEPLMTELRTGIDTAIAVAKHGKGESQATAESGWYSRLPTDDMFNINAARAFAELEGTAVLAGDSPILFEKIRAHYEAMGVFRAVEAYLGERPMLSLAKTVLRRVPPNNGSEWHQDGAFLGADTRVVNLWVTLSDCGVDAPGLDIVARRIPRIVDVGKGDAKFDWSVGPGTVAAEFGAELIQAPVFKAGDAMLFDHFFLHRTGVRPTMTKNRYAVEAWMFAPSTFPAENLALTI